MYSYFPFSAFLFSLPLFFLFCINDSFGDAKFRMILFFFITYKWSRSTGHVKFFFLWKALTTFFFYTILILIISTFSLVHIPNLFYSRTLSLPLTPPLLTLSRNFVRGSLNISHLLFFPTPSPRFDSRISSAPPCSAGFVQIYLLVEHIKPKS